MNESDITLKGIALDIDETLCATNHFWIESLTERFGNPHGLSREEIVVRYRYTQNVPFWQESEALEWMEHARTSDELQEKLPLTEDANHIVNELQKVVPISAYITARPEEVRNGTQRWLTQHGFPKAPLIMRPSGATYTDGNKWKAGVLAVLYPKVWGIIDDNPGLIEHLPEDYKGTIFLYDHIGVEREGIRIVPIEKWDDVLNAVTNAADMHTK